MRSPVYYGMAFLLDTQGCTPRNGDVDGNACVDDADLLTVPFNFGATGQNDADVNCDNMVDDADLLIMLFNFGLCNPICYLTEIPRLRLGMTSSLVRK